MTFRPVAAARSSEAAMFAPESMPSRAMSVCTTRAHAGAHAALPSSGADLRGRHPAMRGDEAIAGVERDDTCSAPNARHGLGDHVRLAHGDRAEDDTRDAKVEQHLRVVQARDAAANCTGTARRARMASIALQIGPGPLSARQGAVQVDDVQPLAPSSCQRRATAAGSSQKTVSAVGAALAQAHAAAMAQVNGREDGEVTSVSPAS